MVEDLAEELESLLKAGNEAAVRQLLGTYRERLKRMVCIHLDRKLAARLDASDVVQEGLAEAVQRLPQYVKDRPIAFYPWLRKLTWEKLLQLRQHHLDVQKRSPHREHRLDLSDESTMQLAERLVATGTSPGDRALKRELRQRVRDALAQLPTGDREVLSMRYLEQLTVAEASAVLSISVDAFMKRHWRAMQRIRPLLEK